MPRTRHHLTTESAVAAAGQLPVAPARRPRHRGRRGPRQLGTGPAAPALPGTPTEAPERSITMAEAVTVSGAISGTDRSLSFETGKLAQQSQGAVVARL